MTSRYIKVIQLYIDQIAYLEEILNYTTDEIERDKILDDIKQNRFILGTFLDVKTKKSN